jgi:hypothetical protein
VAPKELSIVLLPVQGLLLLHLHSGLHHGQDFGHLVIKGVIQHDTIGLVTKKEVPERGHGLPGVQSDVADVGALSSDQLIEGRNALETSDFAVQRFGHLSVPNNLIDSVPIVPDLLV